MKKNIRPALINGHLLVCMLGILPIIAGAASTNNVTVKITVVAPPPCIVNNNKVIDVDFGEVMTTRVDGTNYRKQVNYTLACPNSSSKLVKLQIQGIGASFDSSVLKTSVNGLGIKLQKDSNKLPINSWLNFTYPNAPDLWAVPVMQTGTNLLAGDFTAGATMKIDYQ